MKKLVSIVLALAMVLLCVGVAMADVNITVHRDTTYDGETSEAGRAYTWYKVFSAVHGSDYTGTTGGGYDSDGTPGAVTGDTTHPVSYIATQAVANKLGTWSESTDPKWTKKEGNLWFNLSLIVGTNNYNVTWTGATDTDTAQAAAKWLLDHNVYESSGTLSFANGDWTATVDEGYYILQSDSGNNLVAATTNMTINEKNSYPPLDKTQGDEDDAEQNYTKRDVAVGDVLTYNVTVTIPASAAVGDEIVVYDRPSQGLTYDDNLTIKVDGNDPATGVISDVDLQTGDIWRKKITVRADDKGKDVVFAFTMTVNANALVDTDRENEADLIYNNNYEAVPKTVEYTTYFAGIEKLDGADSTALVGVKFDLKEDGVAFNVTPVYNTAGDATSGVAYYIPGGDSNEVITGAGGIIKIRGLDEDKTYTLTETYTLPGYNMLTEDVTLTNKVEDTGTAFADATNATWTDVINNKGTTLPSTGGIGTTIFYIVGGILLVGAAIILVSRRKAHE